MDECLRYWLLIANEIQPIGGEVGPTYEVLMSRTQCVSAQTEIKARIVACGVSLADTRDLGESTRCHLQLFSWVSVHQE